MAGNPIRRARREAALKEEPIRAPDVRGLSDGERIALLARCSLERVEELMAIPWARALPGEQLLQVRVFEILLKRHFRQSDRREEQALEAAKELQAFRAANEKREPST